MTAVPGPYRLLDHTGDMAILVRAPTLAEIFDVAARALFDVILDVATVEARGSVAISVHDAADRADVLVRALGELLFLHDARDWVFRGLTVLELTETKLRGEGSGEAFDPARHAMRRQVKAVTYHRALLREDRDGWIARLTLDL